MPVGGIRVQLEINFLYYFIVLLIFLVFYHMIYFSDTSMFSIEYWVLNFRIHCMFWFQRLCSPFGWGELTGTAIIYSVYTLDIYFENGTCDKSENVDIE